MKCVSFHRTGKAEEFLGSQCVCEGFRCKGVLFCLEMLWRIRRPAGSRENSKFIL